MKKQLVQFFLLQTLVLSCVTISWSQSKETAIDSLERFTLTLTPAFTLMGVEPTSIDRPVTPKDLGVSLVNSGITSGIIPNNYAVEVAPYWLTPHPFLSYKEYMEAGVGQQFLQSLSLSLATSKAAFAPDSGTDIGLGMRFQFSSGEKSSKLVELENKLGEISKQMALAEAFNDSTKIKQLEPQRKAIALELNKGMFVRKGWLVEISAAAITRFLENDFSRGKLIRFGIWGTISYRPDECDFELLGIGRLIWNNEFGGDGNNLDIGGRIIWHTGRIQLSAEALSRTVYNLTLEKSAAGVVTFTSTYRAAANIEYKIDSKNTIVYTFGRNFAQLPGTNSLISLIGIKLGLGN